MAMREIETKLFKRVSKKDARKIFDSGKPLLIVPWKLNPDLYNGFAGGFFRKETTVDCDFDKLCDRFIYYNCQYNEWGKYPAFYVRKEDIA